MKPPHLSRWRRRAALEANWHVVIRPGLRKALNKATPMGAVAEQLEHIKTSIRVKVEHPFHVIKRRTGM